MEQSRSFDAIAGTYNSTRPGYPSAIYKLASKVGILGSDSKILEIGAGNGVATQELAEHINCHVDAIEPGQSFRELLRSRFEGNPNVSIFNCTFEDYTSKTTYDAIFAATSFHWIDPNIKFRKSSNLLSKSGILVIYWNCYSLENRTLNDKIQFTYLKHFPNRVYSSSVYDIQEEKIICRQREIEDCKIFRMVESTRYMITIVFTVDKYIDLLRTFSENAVLDKSISEPFYEDISNCLRRFSEPIRVNILTNVEISRRI